MLSFMRKNFWILEENFLIYVGFENKTALVYTTPSNEFFNGKCQPKLAGIFGVTSQYYPLIKL